MDLGGLIEEEDRINICQGAAEFGIFAKVQQNLVPLRRRSQNAPRLWVWITTGCGPLEYASASALEEIGAGRLIAIDRLRDEHGIAANDTRHPDVMSERPWPPETAPS